MNTNSQSRATARRRLRWIAAGFVGAFAASVLTVIYTGLMVEGSRSDFDAGFRSVTLAPGEVRSISLAFDSPTTVAAARLEVSLPEVLEAPGGQNSALMVRDVGLVPGINDFTVDVRARAPGSGYLIARVIGEEPVALERVFVTVVAD